MILAIDIGNSNIVVGGLTEDATIFIERLSTDCEKTELEYAIDLKNILEIHKVPWESIEGSILSSVVPPVSSTIRQAVEKLLGQTPLLVGPGIKTGLNLLVDNPTLLGSDRVADAVAAAAYYPLPAIVVDMGTATTISVVDKDKNFLGGFITAGVRTALNSMTRKTSQLPQINLDAPAPVIGTNTVDCMRSGILYGTASMLDHITARMEEELKEPACVVATGGLARFIIPYCQRKILYDDGLLLKGLLLLYQKNRPSV